MLPRRPLSGNTARPNGTDKVGFIDFSESVVEKKAIYTLDRKRAAIMTRFGTV